jgi:hypothetical protein
MKPTVLALASVALLYCVAPLFASDQKGGVAPDILKAWPGRWSCIDSASDGSAHDRYQLDAADYGKWLKFSLAYTPRPGPQRQFETLFHFDAKTQHWFTLSYGSGGGFIAAKSTTSGNAATQTFINLYPVDPAQEPGTIIMHPSEYSTFDAVTRSGKRVTYHTVCTKISGQKG